MMVDVRRHLFSNCGVRGARKHIREGGRKESFGDGHEASGFVGDIYGQF